MRERLDAFLPFLVLGVAGALFDAVRRLDPVPIREVGGFYAGDVTVHLLGFPVGLHEVSLWSGTLPGLRPIYLLELAMLYVALHAVASVLTGVAYARAIPDAESPTASVHARLFVVAVGTSLLLGPVSWVAELEFLALIVYLVLVVLAILPILVAVPPILVAERVTVREAYARADDIVSGQYVHVLVMLLVVGVLADALVSVPVIGGFLGTAGGAALYAELGWRTYTTG